MINSPDMYSKHQAALAAEYCTNNSHATQVHYCDGLEKRKARLKCDGMRVQFIYKGARRKQTGWWQYTNNIQIRKPTENCVRKQRRIVYTAY